MMDDVLLGFFALICTFLMAFFNINKFWIGRPRNKRG
ncbi:hypothetical protein SAMN06264849_11561 [Melghirimyces algeriensis]|uniref:Uncharacterized protein n=1 Tax=Melghirimyces algeriensis TaxID=910412 RepID=A0A521FCA5_9BACL|nr:hypothetical protein SAMN06264849_11561 [Melghirimyces algeriensis]